MKDKFGFTLIELIITIALLAALSVVVGLNISNMLANQEQREIEQYKKNIENAACIYVDQVGLSEDTCTTNPSLCQIPVSVLIERSLISKKLDNPETKETANEDNNYVQISWENYEKKCQYSYYVNDDQGE